MFSTPCYLGLGESNKFLLAAIPENQLEAARQITEAEIHTIAKKMLIRLMAGPQVVIGYALTQVMDTVKCNIRRKPVKNAWKNKIATALHRPFEVTPSLRSVRIGTREVVLHEEDADEDSR